jgi:outer membrane receptor for ferrienterochelin and colicins
MTNIIGAQVAHQKINTFSAFSQSEWRLSSLLISAGIRFDKYQIEDIINRSEKLNGNVLSPRISLLWHASEDLQFRTSFARGFRAPQIFDEDLHIETSGARQVLHKNDENLKQETSNSYSASMSYTHQTLYSQYQFLVEGFITHLANPFSNEYGVPDEDGVVIYTRKNAEEGAVVKGINLELNISPSRKFQFQSGFTLQSSAYETPQEFNEKRFFRAPSHYGYATMNWSATNRLDLALSGNYTGSMLIPYFGPRLENPEDGMLIKSDSFLDSGIKLSYTFPILKSGKAQINAGIKNIFNSYQNDFDIGIDRDPAYIYGPATPRTVYFGIKLGNF